jgi:hypothetical protein
MPRDQIGRPWGSPLGRLGPPRGRQLWAFAESRHKRFPMKWGRDPGRTRGLGVSVIGFAAPAAGGVGIVKVSLTASTIPHHQNGLTRLPP